MSPLPMTGIVNRLLDRGNPLPLRLAAISLFAGAGVQRNGIQPFGLGHARQIHADDLLHRSSPCGT